MRATVIYGAGSDITRGTRRRATPRVGELSFVRGQVLVDKLSARERLRLEHEHGSPASSPSTLQLAGDRSGTGSTVATAADGSDATLRDRHRLNVMLLEVRLHQFGERQRSRDSAAHGAAAPAPAPERPPRRAPKQSRHAALASSPCRPVDTSTPTLARRPVPFSSAGSAGPAATLPITPFWPELRVTLRRSAIPGVVRAVLCPCRSGRFAPLLWQGPCRQPSRKEITMAGGRDAFVLAPGEGRSIDLGIRNDGQGERAGDGRSLLAPRSRGTARVWAAAPHPPRRRRGVLRPRASTSCSWTTARPRARPAHSSSSPRGCAMASGSGRRRVASSTSSSRL